MRGFTYLLGEENNHDYYLYISENHPILDNFSFQTGFYLVNTDKNFEHLPRGYLGKFVEVGDKITITPYETADEPLEEPRESVAQIKAKPTSEMDKKIISHLIQYFQKNDIKEMKLENGKLIIIHSNNDN